MLSPGSEGCNLRVGHDARDVERAALARAGDAQGQRANGDIRQASGDQFRLANGQWIFNLDTRATGMSAGTWVLLATLSDGSQHTAWIQLK